MMLANVASSVISWAMALTYQRYRIQRMTTAFSTPKAAWGHHQLMVPGAGLEPARPQWPGDFKCLATTSRYISVHLATT